MIKIYIPVDAKSLFVNIFNDNKSGHTSTVCTPIKQGKSVHTDVEQIFKIPKQIDFCYDIQLNDYLNKSSKSTTKVTNVFLFDKITVNGIKVHNEESFCMFVKEEIDPEKYQFGRQKLHYPTSISYQGLFSFDNRHVISQISKALHDFAFVVRGFYYDFDNDVLDFDVDIVGYNQIPYSKVFISNKGTGNKYIQDFHDTFDNYDIELLTLKKHFDFDNVTPANFLEKVFEMKSKAFGLLQAIFEKKSFSNVNEIYPYALFDITYTENGIKKYGFISFTSTKECYFNFTIKQWQFINEFEDFVEFYHVSELYNNPKVSVFSFEDILEMNRTITSLSFKK